MIDEITKLKARIIAIKNNGHCDPAIAYALLDIVAMIEELQPQICSGDKNLPISIPQPEYVAFEDLEERKYYDVYDERENDYIYNPYKMVTFIAEGTGVEYSKRFTKKALDDFVIISKAGDYIKEKLLEGWQRINNSPQ